MHRLLIAHFSGDLRLYRGRGPVRQGRFNSVPDPGGESSPGRAPLHGEAIPAYPHPGRQSSGRIRSVDRSVAGGGSGRGAQEYLDALTDLVERFEGGHVLIPNASEADVLRELVGRTGSASRNMRRRSEFRSPPFLPSLTARGRLPRDG